jgi:hypothetical protein
MRLESMAWVAGLKWVVVQMLKSLLGVVLLEARVVFH